jgi:hypothetical protein
MDRALTLAFSNSLSAAGKAAETNSHPQNRRSPPRQLIFYNHFMQSGGAGAGHDLL